MAAALACVTTVLTFCVYELHPIKLTYNEEKLEMEFLCVTEEVVCFKTVSSRDLSLSCRVSWLVLTVLF